MKCYDIRLNICHYLNEKNDVSLKTHSSCLDIRTQRIVTVKGSLLFYQTVIRSSRLGYFSFNFDAA